MWWHLSCRFLMVRDGQVSYFDAAPNMHRVGMHTNANPKHIRFGMHSDTICLCWVWDTPVNVQIWHAKIKLMLKYVRLQKFLLRGRIMKWTIQEMQHIIWASSESILIPISDILHVLLSHVKFLCMRII